ncbi:hypothetical protein GJ496_004016 [Pomphorhynchus laevis]|nr:hypothetical protein GJ496_004016 [Pomphorhynchus laevis]
MARFDKSSPVFDKFDESKGCRDYCLEDDNPSALNKYRRRQIQSYTLNTEAQSPLGSNNLSNSSEFGAELGDSSAEYYKNFITRNCGDCGSITINTDSLPCTKSIKCTDPNRQMIIERMRYSNSEDQSISKDDNSSDSLIFTNDENREISSIKLSNENLCILPSGLGSGQSDDRFIHKDYRENAFNHIAEHDVSNDDGMQCCFNNSTSDPLPSQPVYNHYQLQYDPKPIVIYKASKNPPAIYKQNVIIKYLKPPSLPQPGPIIIREILSPQIPPAPPLIIRQRMPNPPTPPPLILRERPPIPPKVVPSQVIIKKLPPHPPAPRQVIIERYPPLPPKPQDIIIERWLPYEINKKRKVIYQMAPKVEKNYSMPRNLIITYQAKKPLLETVVNRIGTVQMEPEEYMARHRDSVLDTSILLERAKQAGVLQHTVTYCK